MFVTFLPSMMCKLPQIQVYLVTSALLQRVSQMNHRQQWCNEWQDMKQKVVEGNKQQPQVRSGGLTPEYADLKN